MRKRTRCREESELKSALSKLLSRELENVSDCLYFSSVCENDYPELSEFFDGLGREHAENMKLLERALCKLFGGGGVSIRTNANVTPVSNASTLVSKLAEREKEDALFYEKVYLIDRGELEEPLKEILRASKERLSILENILKT